MSDTPQSTALAPLAEATSLLEIISRAVADPRMDVEKMERLFALHERMQAEERRKAFMAALARLQAKLPQIRKDGRIVVGGQERSHYARIEDIDVAIRPLLAEEGFAFTFDEEAHTENETRFSAVLSHRDGHSEVKRRTFPTDKAMMGQKGPVRTPIQDAGSTTSYARRYLLKMHLNLVERGEDDDGTGSIERISDEQVRDIETLIQDSGANLPRFLKYMDVSDVREILARDFKKAISSLSMTLAKTTLDNKRKAEQ